MKLDLLRRQKLDSLIQILNHDNNGRGYDVKMLFDDVQCISPFFHLVRSNFHKFDIKINQRIHDMLKKTLLPITDATVEMFRLEMSINDATGLDRNVILYAYESLLIQTPSYQKLYQEALYYGVIGGNTSSKSRRYRMYQEILNQKYMPFRFGDFSRIRLVNHAVYEKVCEILNEKENEFFNSFWNPSEINLCDLFRENIKDECHNPL